MSVHDWLPYVQLLLVPATGFLWRISVQLADHNARIANLEERVRAWTSFDRRPA